MYTEDKTIRQLVAKYAPAEGFKKAKRVEVTPCEILHMTGENWSGGSKNEYVGVNLSTGEYANVEPPPFYKGDRQPLKMESGLAVICYGWRGMGKCVEVFVHPSNMIQELEKPPSLSERQLALLYCTSAYKNTYSGRTDIRRQEACRHGYPFTREEWIAEQANLVKMGLLDTRGSLTTKGRNAAPNSLGFK